MPRYQTMGSGLTPGAAPMHARSHAVEAVPPTHGLKALRVLVRKHLDGRTSIAPAVERFKANLVRGRQEARRLRLSQHAEHRRDEPAGGPHGTGGHAVYV